MHRDIRVSLCHSISYKGEGSTFEHDGDFQILPILEWKWIAWPWMFLERFHQNYRPIHSSYAKWSAHLYIHEEVLYGISIFIISYHIISYWGAQFTSSFWRTFQDEFDTVLTIAHRSTHIMMVSRSVPYRFLKIFFGTCSFTVWSLVVLLLIFGGVCFTNIYHLRI